MSSGKQTSFVYGEIEPQQRFKSTDVTYGNALSKLPNGYVLSDGGVSNRPGFRYVETSDYQEELPSVGGSPAIKGFPFYSESEGFFVIVEYYYDSAFDPPGYRFFQRGVAFPTGGISYTAPTPEQIRITPYEDKALITPDLKGQFRSAISPFPIIENDPGVYTLNSGGSSPNILFLEEYGAMLSDGPAGGVNIAGGGFGTAPFLPVTYLVTQEKFNGSETFYGKITTGPLADSVTPPASNETLQPHAELVSFVTVDVDTSFEDVKGYNLYRGAGRDASFLYLVAKMVLEGGETEVKFEDYGVIPQLENPPTDNSLLGGDGRRVVGQGMNTAAYYQQRMFVSYNVEIAERFKRGDIGASKIGAPDMLRSPYIFTNTGAFSFNVPVTDGTNVVAMMAMDRLIVLTEQYTYVIRGSEDGVVTPTSINPSLITEEGCSTIVEPKQKGKAGFYLNNDHTKLIGLVFGIDGNVEVGEISLKSNHLVTDSDIHAMEVVGGKEDTVYLLRRDGKLVRVTMGEAPGFSLIETDGFIENIFVKKERRSYAAQVPQTNMADASNRLDREFDSLYAYVTRDNVRYLERLEYREDTLDEGFFFADAAIEFGERLSLTPNGLYMRYCNGQEAADIIPSGTVANMVTATTWEAGQTIEIQSSQALPASFFSDPQLYDFFYEDSNGEKQSIRFTPVSSSGAGPVGYEFQTFGYFDQDVPEELQDINSLSLSAKELRRRQSFFVSLRYSITGATHLADKEVSMFADGQVISSPLNPQRAADTLTVDGSGDLEFPEPFGYGYIGLPYTFEFETLDLEASDNRTLTDSNKRINAAGIAFDETRGGFIGTKNAPIEKMTEIAFREEDDVSIPTENFSDHIEVPVQGEWERSGRINIKQVDPLPMTIVAVYPKGVAGD